VQIEFKRTGGFAGLQLQIKVDTESLDATAGGELSGLVTAANFFALPAQILNPSSGADQYQYTLTVSADGQQHTVETTEQSAPSALQPLLQRLNRMARSQGQQS
jgi:hypothetical protein